MLFQTKTKNEFNQYEDSDEKPRIWDSLQSLTDILLRPKKYQQEQR